MSQYLDGAPIEKKTVAKLVRRASLNAVPFDFKKEAVRLEATQQIQKKVVQDASFSGLQDQELTSTDISESKIQQFHIGIPEATIDRNPCEFIYLGDNLEDQCDYIFYRVYTLSRPEYLEQSKDKDYLERKREVLNEWIGKKTFLSMCLTLNIIDDR